MTYNTIDNDVTMAGGAGTLLANRYRVVKQLGHGGMGSVWLAEDTQLDNKQFAVKMLPSILVSNKRAYRQLKDEALVAMKLTHPNIVTLRAFEENNGNPFLVMDYIDGQSLDDYLAEKGKLSEDETIKLLRPIAAALDYAHTKGVVHRDVKPGNIMIAKDGTPYILDFGIAREIQETMTRVTGKLSSGTLLYMSPEQLRGQPSIPAQDVYSFAAMAYECIKGEPPFSHGQIEYQIINEPPVPLSEGACAVSIMSGLSKKPEDRPATCAGVLEGHTPSALRATPHIPVGTGGEYSAKGSSHKIGEVARQGRRDMITVLALLVGLAGGVWLYYYNLERRREQTCIAAVHKSEAERKADEDRTAEGKDDLKAKEEDVGKLEEERRMAVERVKCEELVNNVAVALTIAFDRNGFWPQAILKNHNSQQGLDADVAVALSQITENAISVNVSGGKAVGLDRFGIVSPWATSLLKSKGHVASVLTKVPTGGTIQDHRLRYAIDLDGDGIIEDVDIGGELIDIRAIAAVWCCGMDGKLEAYSEGLRKDDVYSWSAGQTRNVRKSSIDTHITNVREIPVSHKEYVAPKHKEQKTLTLPGGATMEMIYVGPQEFDMGSNNGDNDEKPVHKVRLTKGYWLGKCEVTQGQWQSVMNQSQDWLANRAGYRTRGVGGDNPVYYVSWNDCQEFLAKVQNNVKSQFGNFKASLPTEAQWECACRAGTTGDYAGNISSMAWYGANSGFETHPVGQKSANAWGFHDMHGNVWEWCSDWYGGYPSSSVVDPSGPVSGSFRVIRDGSWFNGVENCRSANRDWYNSDYRWNFLGFRLALASIT